MSDVEQDGLETFCATTFAACATTGRFASIRSKLALMLDTQMQAEFQSPHEFSFEIEFLSLDGSYEDFTTQDRNIVRSYIDNLCAATVMPIVLRQTQLLIMAVVPPIIYRVTKMRSPSEKALAKHNSLTCAIEGQGYQVLTFGYDGFARAYWIMERVASSAS